MTGPLPEDEAPVYDGPDPHDWPDVAPGMWGTVLDIEALNRVIEAMDGPVEPGDALVHGEARKFLDDARKAKRAEVASAVLRAYRVPLPEEPAGLATEATGGFRGNGNGPGDRDHM